MKITFLVNNAKNILENQNIEVTLKNEFASGAAGVLAPIDTWVELWIINDIDEDKAETVLAQALKQQGEHDGFVSSAKSTMMLLLTLVGSAKLKRRHSTQLM